MAHENYGLTTRLSSGAAAFDVSGFGRLRVSGEDAMDLLDRLSTNDLANLRPDAGMGTVLTMCSQEPTNTQKFSL